MASHDNLLEKAYGKLRLSNRFDGVIYTLDLDKTYLATEFETFSGLIKIPFESARKKQNIPGAAALVREIRRGPRRQQQASPLFFISGSPKQMENVIREKLRIDGVEHDGMLFKDFTSALRKFKFRMIIDKIGFKLNALLYGRSIFPHRADEILYGDDSEYDATIYSLYSDIINGNLEDFEVLTILKKWEIDRGEILKIRENLTRLQESGWKPRDAVRRIFIHLETGSSPLDHLSLSSKVTTTRNYFQTAIILHQMELIARPGLFRVISDLIRGYNWKMMDFLLATEDLLARRLVDFREAKKLLKIVSKGNPLSMPIQWIHDMRREFNEVLEGVNRMQRFALPEPEKISPVDRYLNYSPRRRV